MRSLRPAALVLAALLGSGTLRAPLAAQAGGAEHAGAAALGLQLRRLGVVPRVLMIGAHPDDESTPLLAELALGRGVEVAYLSLTRGEGGQNSIGPELQEGLGLLRTEELLAARRLDGARQYFTRAYDFGFSRDAAETFRHWPRDTLLADVVAVVRYFRPDVVVSVFSGTERDGHGQHQAAGLLARDAFAAAGDARRFRQQLAGGLLPWEPKKLYTLALSDGDATLQVQTGAYDPLLGRSRYQVAMASRSRHRSQDMGRTEPPGPRTTALRLRESRVAAGAGVEESPFAGIDTTLSQLAARAGDTAMIGALRRYEAAVAGLHQAFNPAHPQRLLVPLAYADRLLTEAASADRGRGGASAELLARIIAERQELGAAAAMAAGVVLDAVADDETLVPGQEFGLELSLWNGGSLPLESNGVSLHLPPGWRVVSGDTAWRGVAPGAVMTRRLRVQVPPGAPATEPYFLRAPRRGDLYSWPTGQGRTGVPFEAPPVAAIAMLQVNGMQAVLTREATHRTVDKMQGELRRPLRVVPAVSVALAPELAVVPLGGTGPARPLRFTVSARSEAQGAVQGELRLEAPAGWVNEPAAASLRFAGEGEERVVEFTLRPAAGQPAAAGVVRAVFVAEGGARYARGYTLLDYPHVRPRPLYRPAEAALRGVDVRLPPGLRIGYVMGAGDDGPRALEQLGARVDLLDADALAAADLGRYHAIVTGVRAYEVRPELGAHNARLLEYARRGGTLVVQYNKYEYTEPGVAPYPVSMARPHGRVTNEAAPVRLLAPEHRALSWPNRITAADFRGWVQERGLYFLERWDARYTPLLEMADPGEPPQRGALLVAQYGSGHYVYTGLALFRQLPAGVPGAYRLLANLVSLGSPVP